MQYISFQTEAEKISVEAGKRILSQLKKELIVKHKTSAHDLVTNIDTETEKFIRDKLLKTFPTHSIFGEEFAEDNRDSDYLWVIDPVDGTSSLAAGKPGFSVSIALLHKFEPVVGVVLDVMNNKLYSASRNSGAKVNHQPLISKNNSNAVIALRNNSEPYRSELANILNGAKLKWGYFPSTALAFCIVAEGNGAGLVKLTYNPWDIAGGFVIASELGCLITDCFGDKIIITNIKERNSKGIICAHKQGYQTLKNIISVGRNEKGI